jgi:hypothetical protein
MAKFTLRDETLQEIRDCSDERLDANIKLLQDQPEGFFDLINGPGYTATWLEALTAEEERRRGLQDK